MIDIAVDHGNQINSPMSSLALWQMGGAVARVGENETAFHGRKAGFTFNINGNTETATGFERGAWVGALLLVGARPVPHECLRQLPNGRRRGPCQRRLRTRKVRQVESAQAPYTTQPTSSGSIRTSLLIETVWQPEMKYQRSMVESAEHCAKRQDTRPQLHSLRTIRPTTDRQFWADNEHIQMSALSALTGDKVSSRSARSEMDARPQRGPCDDGQGRR